MNSNDFDSHEKSSTLVCDLITRLKAVSDRKRREFSPHIICAHLTTGPFVQRLICPKQPMYRLPRLYPDISLDTWKLVGGTRRSGSPKSVGFIFWATWMFVQNDCRMAKKQTLDLSFCPSYNSVCKKQPLALLWSINLLDKTNEKYTRLKPFYFPCSVRWTSDGRQNRFRKPSENTAGGLALSHVML